MARATKSKEAVRNKPTHKRAPAIANPLRVSGLSKAMAKHASDPRITRAIRTPKTADRQLVIAITPWVAEF
jgi:hypothetical protein